jgi:2,3-bisphosphoglycerate-dependent phosphoglycerate mutase
MQPPTDVHDFGERRSIDSVKELMLIRHAEISYGPRVMIAGRFDPSLTEHGQRQAHQLASHLARAPSLLHLVVTSPLVRAQQTALILAEAVGAPVALEADLADVFLGEYEQVGPDALLPAKARQKYVASEGCAFDVFPGAESPDTFRARVARVMDFYSSQLSPSSVGIVTHSHVINCFVRELLGARRNRVFYPLPCSVSRIKMFDNQLVLMSLNEQPR